MDLLLACCMSVEVERRITHSLTHSHSSLASAECPRARVVMLHAVWWGDLRLWAGICFTPQED